jgi:hypothetical protein
VVELISPTSYFNELFINALIFGMTYNQFWHREAELYWAYQVAYEKKLEEQYEFENYKAWLNGLYNFDAISKSNYNTHARGQGDSPEQYMFKPIDWKQLEKQDKEEVIKQKSIANENSIKNMLNMKKSIIDSKKEG